MLNTNMFDSLALFFPITEVNNAYLQDLPQADVGEKFASGKGKFSHAWTFEETTLVSKYTLELEDLPIVLRCS